MKLNHFHKQVKFYQVNIFGGARPPLPFEGHLRNQCVRLEDDAKAFVVQSHQNGLKRACKNDDD
jgi:hypothetical protein